MIRLLALDIDDTLTGRDRQVSPANLAAVADARAAGIEVIIITGWRWADSAERYRAQLGLDTLTYCYAGAKVVRPDGVIDEHRPLPLDLALAVAGFAHEKGLALQAFVDDSIYGERSIEPFMAARRQFDPSLAATYTAEPHIVPDLGAFFREGNVPTQLVPLGEEAVEAIRERFGALSVGEEAGPDTSPYGKLQMYVHEPETPFHRMTILKGGVNKGEALARHCRRFGFLRGETAAVGDSAMDGPMIAWAGFGVALDTAPAWAQASAELVLPAGDEAVAAAVTRLLSRR